MIAFLKTLLDGGNQGLLWALLALGVFITFRILDFADLTAEGSFTMGGAVAITMIHMGVPALLGTLIAIVAGSLAGLCTALLNTKLKIPPILAGILTMIALYSINIRIMGNRTNIAIPYKGTVINFFESLGMPLTYSTLIAGLIAAAVTIAGLYWFFGTETGSAIRATGNNPRMCRAQGINTDTTKIIALMLSNAIIAFSGAMVAQQQGSGDINMGIGAIVIGLASVIIGEAFFSAKFSFWAKLAFVVLGSVIYRLIITIIISADIISTNDLKLLTAVIVVFALSLPMIKAKIASLPSMQRRAAKKKAAQAEAAAQALDSSSANGGNGGSNA